MHYSLSLETTAYPDGLAIMFNHQKFKFATKFELILTLHAIALVCGEDINSSHKFLFLHDAINRSGLKHGKKERVVKTVESFLVQNLFPNGVYENIHQKALSKTLEERRPIIEIGGRINTPIRIIKCKLPCGQEIHLQSYSQVRNKCEYFVNNRLLTMEDEEYLIVFCENNLPENCPFLN